MRRRSDPWLGAASLPFLLFLAIPVSALIYRTSFFAGNFPGRTQTMPLAIYLGFEQDMDVALALSAVLIGVSFAALLLVRLFLHRKWR